MRIKELNIVEFGSLVGRHFELSEGLNVIEGNNEAGKSTLWGFIKFMLYGMPKKGHPEREKAINRSTHRASGSMTVSVGGEDYRIERSFSENARGKVVTYRVSDGERVFDGIEPGEAMLGVPKDVFEHSSSIPQGACAGLGGEKGAAAIRNLLSSADESVDIEKLQKKLGAIRVTYRHANGKGGKLSSLSDSINTLERRLSQASEQRQRISELEERLAKNSDALCRAERELSAARGIIEELSRREILKRFERLSENKRQYASLCEHRDALAKSETRGGYTPVAADAAALFAAADACERAYAVLTLAEGELSKLEATSLDEEQRALIASGELIELAGGAEALLSAMRRVKMKRAVGAFLFGAGAVLAIAFGAIAAATNLYFLIGTALGALAGLAGLALFIGNRTNTVSGLSLGNEPDAYVNKSVEALRSHRERDAVLSEARERAAKAKDRHEYLSADLARAMARVRSERAVDVDGARAEAERIRRFAEEYGKLCVRCENLRSVIESDGELLSGYDEAQLRAQLSENDLGALSVKEAESRRKYYEEGLRMLKQRDADLRTELINLKASSEDPTAIGDELAEKRREYGEAERYYEALVTAIDGIDRAAAALQGSVSPAIGHRASELLSRMTEGRYGGVNMRRSLDITLVDGEGLTTTGDMMSGGTKDAAYIALRIALMQRIFCKEMPPFMLDEALCQLDGERAGSVLSVLSLLADEGVQILLFTCHERETELCQVRNIDFFRLQM